MNRIKSYRYEIETKDIDFRRRLSLRSLVNYLLVTAGRNASDSGFGLLDLQNENYTWVLTRLAVDMKRMPNESDSLYIETWIETIGSVFTIRNFRLFDATGGLIGYAASSWAVIDLNTRRSVLLVSLPKLTRYVVNESIPIGEPERIKSIEGEVANQFRVKYSDIDVNGHTNTLNYIKWISDCFSLDFYRTHAIRRFEVNFLKEIMFEDTGEVLRTSEKKDDFYLDCYAR